MQVQLALGSGRHLHDLVLGSTPLTVVADSLDVDGRWILANAIANTMGSSSPDVILVVASPDVQTWEAAIVRHVSIVFLKQSCVFTDQAEHRNATVASRGPAFAWLAAGR